jgi:hypothetical protein
VIAPLHDLEPLFELVNPMPHVALQQCSTRARRGEPWDMRRIYLDALTDDVINITIERLPAKESPMSFVPIFPLDGAIARVPEDQTAFGGSRQTRWTFKHCRPRV